jgi:hypothetical protein
MRNPINSITMVPFLDIRKSVSRYDALAAKPIAMQSYTPRVASPCGVVHSENIKNLTSLHLAHSMPSN